MAMFFGVRTDVVVRNKFAQSELPRYVTIYTLHAKTVPVVVRIRAQMTLQRMHSGAVYVRARTRCILTGRARATYVYTHLSRMLLKECVRSGMLSGFTMRA